MTEVIILIDLAAVRGGYYDTPPKTHTKYLVLGGNREHRTHQWMKATKVVIPSTL